jgi:hypothetical protein
MAITIVGTPAQVTEAINTFSGAYHLGFNTVRNLGTQYLQTAQPIPTAVIPLARELRAVLHQWGAAEPGMPVPGAPGAPVMHDIATFEQTLSSALLHADLKFLTSLPLSRLVVTNNHRAIIGPPHGVSSATFDETLFRVLHALAEELFEANTNVTYPMKAVLLITGLMPAFDGQVKAGLARAGMRGFSGTRYLMPADAQTAPGAKISRLPFLLGECWNMNVGNLSAAIQASLFPALANQPGRVFDVLLFVQGRGNNPIRTIEYQGKAGWYDFS